MNYRLVENMVGLRAVLEKSGDRRRAQAFAAFAEPFADTCLGPETPPTVGVTARSDLETNADMEREILGWMKVLGGHPCRL